MRTLRTLLLLTMLPALSWAQTTLLPYSSASKSPTNTGTTYLYREDSTGLLVQKSRLGPVERVGVDMQNVRGLTDRLSSERTYQQGQFNTFRTTSNGLYRGVNQPFTIGQTPGLSDSLLAKASRAYVDRIVGSGGDSSKTAYAKNVSDLRYPLATTTAQNFASRTARASVAQLRADASNAPPDYYQLSDYRRPYLYRRDALDTTTPDDGALCLVTQAGMRYKIVVPDGRITPQMFGAIGDGVADDGAALLAWINYTGPGSLFLPAGIYRSGVALIRINKGSCWIQAAGPGRSILQFFNDTDGIVITNAANGPLGSISVKSLEIQSTGPKSDGRSAIVQTSQNYRPGPVNEDIAFPRPASLANEWTTTLKYTDCIGTSTRSLYVEGNKLEGRTVGVKISNSAENPSYEHSLIGVNVRGANGGIWINGAFGSSVGTEGIQLTDCNLVATAKPIKAKSYSGSPYIGMRGVHWNSFGGRGIDISGFTQLFYNDVVGYANADAAGNVPDAGVVIDGALAVHGTLFVNTTNNIPAAVKLTGSGGEIAGLRVMAEVFSAQTVGLTVGPGYRGSEVSVLRNWNGNTTWGTVQALDIIDSSGTSVKPLLVAVDPLPVDKSVLTYARQTGGADDYRPHFTYLDMAQAVRGQYVNASATLNPALGNYVDVDNGSSNVTLTIDQSKFTAQSYFYISRYNANSTGTITVQAINPASNQIIAPDGSFVNSYNIPVQGTRTIGFFFAGGKLKVIFGATDSYLRPQFVGGTATVDALATDMVQVGNGSSNVTLTIDVSRIPTGKTIVVKRYDANSTGAVSLQTQNANNKVQDAAGNFNTVTALPTASGNRQMTFMYNGTHLEFIGY